MDKNSLIGWTLIAILMVLMMNTMNKNGKKRAAEEQEKQKTEEVRTADTNNVSPAINNNQTSTQEVTTLSDSAKQAINNSSFGIFGNQANGSEENLVVENSVMTITFTNKGGIPKSVILKDYKTHDQQPLEVYSLKNGEFSVKLFANTGIGERNIITDSLYFLPNKSIDAEGNIIVSYKLLGANDQYYEHRYIIPSEGYLLDFDIKMNNLQNFITKDYFTILWKQRLQSQEGNLATEKMYSSVYYADKQLKVGKIGYRKSTDKTPKVDLQWVSFKQKFFNSTLIAKDEPFDNSSYISSEQAETDDDFVKDLSSELGVQYNKSNNVNFPMQMYFGPNNYKDLKALDINLQKVVQIGVSVFRWVNLYLIMPTFNLLNNKISNYGIIILLLTIFIKIIVFPFTYKSNLSMIKMRVLQPELAELKKKYGKDQAKMGQAQMELYRKAGVNPLGGCLPMLFQMPILIAMYRFFPSSIELRQQGFLWATDLSTYDSIFSWTQQIPFISQIYGNHISLFTILMAITSFFYTRINSQNTPTDDSNPMAAQMKMFQYFMPFMMLFIFNKFSAALSYYYFLFNLLSIGQHYIMKKFMIDEDKIHAEIQANKKKVKTKSKWQQKMEEVLKQQEAQRKARGKK
ncbi:MAG: membrane protein insertase YidC [Bacteroidetes bacterium]|nr:membrane protein insertase YidC [Bacteroidota bacterium]